MAAVRDCVSIVDYNLAISSLDVELFFVLEFWVSTALNDPIITLDLPVLVPLLFRLLLNMAIGGGIYVYIFFGEPS
jgi:hypothetical protein